MMSQNNKVKMNVIKMYVNKGKMKMNVIKYIYVRDPRVR